MAEITPMMKQYFEMKEQNPGCILFFRLGDFYEMFQEDAKLVSRELDLTLTTRDRNKPAEEQVPMCGVPYHSYESYIARLVAKGYKVAICEQMEDPSLAKGLVKREITRVITPGTVTESSMLEEGKNNYIACVAAEAGVWAVTFCDLSTGAFYATEDRGEEAQSKIVNELGRFAPAEILLAGEAASDRQFRGTLDVRFSGCCIQTGDPDLFQPEADQAVLAEQFGQEELSGLPEEPALLSACGGLLLHLRQLEKSPLGHINHLEHYISGQFMELDLTARRNLELTETMRGGEKKGSLLWVLDRTKTSMGSRMLRSWLEKPLLRPRKILRRSAAVEELVNASIGRQELQVTLKGITDMERAMGRVSAGSANARDLLSMSIAMASLPQLKAQLQGFRTELLGTLAEGLDPLEDLAEELSRAIVEENTPFSVREGGIIKPGYDAELDRLLSIKNGGENEMKTIEAQEREKTGIAKLRVASNRVFGFYIEISKAYDGPIPENYIRKQTLANCERYITPELKALEAEVLGAKDRSAALEYDIFTRLRNQVARQAPRIQKTCQMVAAADVLCSLAEAAVENNYVRPEVDMGSEIQITDGRHPVVERMLKDALFVPNDVRLGTAGCQVAVITGPNMAGKSTYMRQAALIVLMAQIGSFVPARSARIGVCDRIFTRIGASDDLSSGQSTFMVEMSEVSEILRCATSRSLLILDEIGRGTSTFDGMAIARAVLEYCAKKLGAKVLFATHYHELTAMEQELPGLKNYNIAVKKRGEDIIFLRKIVPGGADDSYGIEVARLAGLPDQVIRRAKAILRELEQTGAAAPVSREAAPQEDQLSLTDMGGGQIAQRLRDLTIETLTPIEALNILFELKKMAEEV